MAPQNEGNPESRDEQVTSDNQATATERRRSTDVASSVVEPEPFADDDPYRAARIAQINGETTALLSEVQITPTGLQDSTTKELRGFYKDAESRAAWSETRKDEFAGLLRLCKPVPSRGRRIL